MTQYANWSYPTNIRFGVGRISELSDVCIQAGIHKPLLVTDRGLSNHKITHQALDIMEKGGIGRAEFSDVDPALCWTGRKDSGRGGGLSSIGYQNLTRPKSFHLKKLTT